MGKMMTRLQAKLYILYVLQGAFLECPTIVCIFFCFWALYRTTCQPSSWKKRGDASGAPCVIPFQCLGLPYSHFVWSHLHQLPGIWVFGASSPDSLHLQKRFDLGLPPHFTAKKFFIRSTNRCNSWKACKHMSNPHKYTWQFCSHLASWLCWLFCRIHTSMLINWEKLYLCQWPCGHLHKAHQLRFYDGRCSATGHIWTSNRVENFGSMAYWTQLKGRPLHLLYWA